MHPSCNGRSPIPVRDSCRPSLGQHFGLLEHRLRRPLLIVGRLDMLSHDALDEAPNGGAYVLPERQVDLEVAPHGPDQSENGTCCTLLYGFWPLVLRSLLIRLARPMQNGRFQHRLSVPRSAPIPVWARWSIPVGTRVSPGCCAGKQPTIWPRHASGITRSTLSVSIPVHSL